MSETLKALNNIRTLRAQARETDLATLEEMLENSLLSLMSAVRKNRQYSRNKNNVRLSLKPSARNC